MVSSLAYYITLLHKDFSEFCNRELQSIGLSQGLLYFILYVGKHPCCSPRELTCALRMDAGHATRSLSRLEQKGFLIQETNPKDRRSHVLRLLEKGEEAFRFSHELFIRWDQGIAANAEMPEADRQHLLALLRELAQRKEGDGFVRNAVKPC